VPRLQSRVAVAEARQQFRNLKKWESLLLEAVTRRLVKAVNEDTITCGSYLQDVVLCCVSKSPVHLITSQNPIYNHTHMLDEWCQ
jgi:hypothetical protein